MVCVSSKTPHFLYIISIKYSAYGLIQYIGLQNFFFLLTTSIISIGKLANETKLVPPTISFSLVSFNRFCSEFSHQCKLRKVKELKHNIKCIEKRSATHLQINIFNRLRGKTKCAITSLKRQNCLVRVKLTAAVKWHKIFT